MGKVLAFLLYWPWWLLLFVICIAVGFWHHRRRAQGAKIRNRRGWAHAALDE